jgi:RHS repeat-associated protein
VNGKLFYGEAWYSSAVTRTYKYDTLSRLFQETGSPVSQSFDYDANGNRKSNASNLYTYLLNSNRMATRKGVTLTRDAAGNHTSNGLGQTYEWDNHGHLSQFTLNGVKKATYLYNYQHQRTHKTLWNGATALSTTVYHYDLHGRLLMETSSTGAIQAYYVYDDSGTPLAMVQAANSPYNTTAQDRLLYLHTDHLGTPRIATDTAKRIVWKWESDAFGTTAANQDPDADGKTTVINLRFAGQYFDAESGLHQNWHRTYDPSLGRYISSDPIGLRGGLNTFGYVEQNPLALVDPTGRNPATAAEGGYIVGGLIGAAIDYGVSATTGVVGLTLGAYLYDITHSEDSFTQNSVSDQVDTLNTDLANDPSASVPWPEKNRGKWTAICKVVDQSPDSCPTSSGNIVGWGYGIGNDMSSARKAAEKMAKATLGSSNVHHPSCKCISPKGETVPLCR